MPEMDGLTATRTIRNPGSMVRNHGVPIVAMTAHASQVDRIHAMEAGMDDYLSKPFNPKSLSAMLEKWLDRGKETEPVAKSIIRNPEIFDGEGLLSRLMGDEELVAVVIRGFLEDMPRQLQSLKGALDSGDMAGVVGFAHTIAGAAASVGSEKLRRTARQLEQAARNQDVERVDSGFLDLEKHLALVSGVLQEELPLKEEAAVAGESPIPLKILVVEDGEDNRKLLQAYFQKSGDQVDFAADGEEALRCFRENSYDLVFMDLEMPVMDGYAATREIREWEESRGKIPVPIVALSAHTGQQEEAKSRCAGCDGYLCKPIKKKTLMEAVDRYRVSTLR